MLIQNNFYSDYMKLSDCTDVLYAIYNGWNNLNEIFYDYSV